MRLQVYPALSRAIVTCRGEKFWLFLAVGATNEKFPDWVKKPYSLIYDERAALTKPLSMKQRALSVAEIIKVVCSKLGKILKWVKKFELKVDFDSVFNSEKWICYSEELFILIDYVMVFQTLEYWSCWPPLFTTTLITRIYNTFSHINSLRHQVLQNKKSCL